MINIERNVSFSHECIPSPYGLCLGEVDAVRKGQKEIKISNKNHPINHQHTVYSI